MPSGRQGKVECGQTVLDAARQLGVGIESICGGRQTCGKCLIAHETGIFQKHGIESKNSHLTPPEAEEQAYAEEHGLDLSKYRLSCSARLKGDALIFVPESSLARKQVIRKEASDLQIAVNPAVRLMYITVEPAILEGTADWERVQRAVSNQWHASDIQLDPVLFPRLQSALRQGNWAITLTLWNNAEVIRIEPGYVERMAGFAVDVGSTTLAGHLVDLLTGQVLATRSMMNPQVRYGEDLMSRVSYGITEPEGLARMHRAVLKAVNDLAVEAAASVDLHQDDIVDVVLVGNTVMHHILLGIDPVELGGAPFALAVSDPVDIKARDLGLTSVSKGAYAHILPCIAGHVGADNAAVLLAEQPQLDDQITLVVDIGTNAEILLGNRTRMLSASSPTGPAFEGAQITHGQRATPGAIERFRIDTGQGQMHYKVVGDQRWSGEIDADQSLKPTGICGSGIIEVVGELFIHRLIDRSGRFVKDAESLHPAVRLQPNGRTYEVVIADSEQTSTGHDIVVTQNDIRQIQLAKGALYAGIRLLMERFGTDRVDRIKLAGAFGSYIDPTYAMVIGLIPDCDLINVTAVGNSAGDGARIALLNAESRKEAQEAARSVEYVETAIAPHFQEFFVAAMALPHAEDKFPHLAGILPPRNSPGDRRKDRSSRSRRTG
nr:DUF4445 domain-containing protein [Anaerolineae bacterium]